MMFLRAVLHIKIPGDRYLCSFTRPGKLSHHWLYAICSAGLLVNSYTIYICSLYMQTDQDWHMKWVASPGSMHNTGCLGLVHTQRDGTGGRREEGSGWGTHVYLWWMHVDIWQNQYNIVKLKNKINLKKRLTHKSLTSNEKEIFRTQKSII